jgi:long-subunit acyl-CoA synthetase (AMP-forming)
LPYPGIDGNSIEKALEQVNAQLPDYAQIRAYCIAREPFTLSNGLATANGRPKRAAILQSYATQIQALYTQDLNTSQLNLVGENS